MNATWIALIVLGFTLGGAALGMWLRAVLPEHHVSDASERAVNLAIGLIATITALVLGLVVASAKSAFDKEQGAVETSAADLLTLDSTLAAYGPEAAPIRAAIRDVLAARMGERWLNGADELREEIERGGPTTERLVGMLITLSPQSDGQRWLRDQALALADDVLRTRWLALESASTPIPTAFLVTLVLWLSLIFASFGLVSPRNETVVAMLVLCAVSVSGAMFLILEMNGPFDGLVQVSPEPLRYALEHLGK
jgi:hypothetical protein